MTISPATKLTTVIGNPVAHSMSPLIHNAIYAKENVDAVMLAFGNSDIASLVQAIRTLPIHLAAVTMPHKQTIIPLLDSIDEDARTIGSVNTVINRDGKLFGYNTDLTGIAASLKGVELKNKNVLIIGAGGVAQPIAFHLRRSGANIFCHNRDPKQTDALCKKFDCTSVDAPAMESMAFDVIVNATPVGMPPNTDVSPIDKKLIRPNSVVFDVVYASVDTKLVRDAREQGARGISGLTMFVAQAIEQERLWLGKDIADAGYTALVEKELHNRSHA